ncbi:MAG: MotA/TolQ/ExbB proton channel family protein [Bacteroidales bacterium]|jgi:hypothetical protein|nr:MotA/TolQ/ExbB proton channel family protein [Bacteroidales bacterium]
MMTQLINKFNEGGPFFTYPVLIILIVILVLFIKGLMDKTDNSKTISLLSSFGWFAIAWAFLGRTFGLVVAFDNISAHGELTVNLLAEGLKMALINPILGIFVFIIARAGIITLTLVKKETKE